MLFYLKCPSCSRLLSVDLDLYYQDLENIQNDPTLNRKQKELLAAKLLDKYGYRYICCRIRIMG